MVNSQVEPLDRVFAALSDPTRRRLLAALSHGARTVGDLATPLPISLVAVTKHLSVLERAGLVERTRRGRRVVCTLRGRPLHEAAGWLERYRDFWDERLDSLETFLNEEGRA
jgi:DNA-binding transcriptional ArsR family regulator